MKIKELLKMQEIIHNNKIPSDIEDIINLEHLSLHKKEYVSVKDMDLIYFLRHFASVKKLSIHYQNRLEDLKECLEE
jgi:hypothetical protein